MPDVGTAIAIKADRLLEEELEAHPEFDRTLAHQILSLKHRPPFEFLLSIVGGMLAAAIIPAVATIRHQSAAGPVWIPIGAFFLGWISAFFAWGMPRIKARQNKLLRFSQDAPALYELVEDVLERARQF